MSKEAMKQALDFLRSGHFTYPTKIATDLEEALANEDADAQIIKYHEATIARLQEALAKQEQGEPEDKTRTEFESWHKAKYVQPLERYAHTYKNMHVRNRWQGWLAAHGIKE